MEKQPSIRCYCRGPVLSLRLRRLFPCPCWASRGTALTCACLCQPKLEVSVRGSKDWGVDRPVRYLLRDWCGRAQSIVSGTIPGLFVLGSIGRQAEQVRGASQ